LVIIFAPNASHRHLPTMPKHAPSRPTVSRKKQHVDLTLRSNVGFRSKTTGLERWEFIHNALPEIDLPEIDTTCRFLGKKLSHPFMISSMTGGYGDALRINRLLAAACEEMNIAMGVGSQRQALEDATYHKTFSVVREVAPTIPIAGNLGAAEAAKLEDTSGILRLAELVGADAFIIHLNPLQELLQPEGTPLFRGVLKGIQMLVRELPIPIIVKEIGAGLSAGTVRRLLEAGVTCIDVAGAGGTSWAGVELLRRGEEDRPSPFWDWGIPTGTAVQDAAALKGKPWNFTLIASGGLHTGMDAAKCIALGADMAASARPMLKALEKGGPRGLQSLLQSWAFELRGAMFLTGSRTIADLQRVPLMRTDEQ
jgi:isopentenyl-diphosphate Delta-isomerase